jgi:hypothetical protein
VAVGFLILINYKNKIMGKGDYSGPKYGGSRSGWEKGYKDAKNESLWNSLLKVLSEIAKAISENKKK